MAFKKKKGHGKKINATLQIKKPLFGAFLMQNYFIDQVDLLLLLVGQVAKPLVVFS